VSDSATYTERVRDTFLARPGEWIDGLELERIGGRYAWRSRISDVRRYYGLTIENRVQTVRGEDGTVYRRSEYRYSAPKPADATEWLMLESANQEGRLF